jgi:hypothetical protein
VALIVGSILNLINQGDALFGEGRLNLTKMILTFAKEPRIHAGEAMVVWNKNFLTISKNIECD